MIIDQFSKSSKRIQKMHGKKKRTIGRRPMQDVLHGIKYSNLAQIRTVPAGRNSMSLKRRASADKTFFSRISLTISLLIILIHLLDQKYVLLITDANLYMYILANHKHQGNLESRMSWDMICSIAIVP